MFARLRFDDNSEGVYNLKKISILREDRCIVNHRGSKYEATILAVNNDKKRLYEAEKGDSLVNNSTKPLIKPNVGTNMDTDEGECLYEAEKCNNAANNSSEVMIKLNGMQADKGFDESLSEVEKCNNSASNSSELLVPLEQLDVMETTIEFDDQERLDEAEECNNSANYSSAFLVNLDVMDTNIISDDEENLDEADECISSANNSSELLVKLDAMEPNIESDEESLCEAEKCNSSMNNSSELLVKLDETYTKSGYVEASANNSLENVLDSLTEVNTSNSLLNKSIPSEISILECERRNELLNMDNVGQRRLSFASSKDDSVIDPDYEPSDAETEQTYISKEDEQTDMSKKDDYISNSSLNHLSPNYACDDTNLIVMESRGRKGDKKSNFCLYCHTNQQKISRHLENKHSDQEEVKKFMLLPKGNSERKQLIGKLRKKGNFLYNTNENFNEGDLIVTRRRQRNSAKTAKDYKACPNCKGFFSKKTLRVHFKKCTGKSTLTKRIVIQLSKKVTGRIHSCASEKVKNVLFPVLQEDNVTMTIRYDELVIMYANKMCEKYRNPRFYDMIRHRIRLLGRFLCAIKEINKDITDLTSVFDPKFADSTLNAINKIAKFNCDLNTYETPTVAFSMGTLLKQVGNILINECIKRHNQIKKNYCKDYLKILSLEINCNVNRTVAESQLQIKRRKNIVLPPMEDIKKLHMFLLEKRNKALRKIKKQYTFNIWMELAKSTLISIQTFNRRRPGETERILIEDFMTYKSISDNNHDLFTALSSENKQIANKYVRFCIRGKLNRTVPVLLDKNMLECVRTLIKFRTNTGVPKNNPYIFGIPGKDKTDFAYLRACPLMRQYSQECNAKFPMRLRATSLRKHIATTCISFNLQEQEVSDVANFMGHAESIHKNIYRQPQASREILFMSKILEKVQGGDEIEANQYFERSDDEERRVERTRKNLIEENEDEETDIDDEVADEQVTSTVRKRSTSPYGSVRRVRWTNEEKEIVTRVFKDHIKSKTLPSLSTIGNVIRKYPELQRRSSPQIKTWLHNQYKKK